MLCGDTNHENGDRYWREICEIEPFRKLHYGLWRKFEELLVKVGYYFGSYEKRVRLMEFVEERKRKGGRSRVSGSAINTVTPTPD